LPAGALALLLAGVLAPAAAAQPTPSPPYTVAGPSAAIVSLDALSVARDGTGGLVYLATAGGVTHVFVSPLLGGRFQPPQLLDAGLVPASSQPVIAAGNGGVLLVGFINGATLYVVDKANATAAFASPSALAGAASNPSLQMSNFGKAYLAFTVADGAGHDVRAAYYAGGSWSLEAAPLNSLPAPYNPGTEPSAPAVATAGDGVAAVAWGEGGHVYSRRVWGTSPSVVDEQADVPSVGGCGELSASHPSVAAEGNSSYIDVAFQEMVSCGGGQQARVLVNRLRGSQYDGAVAADGLSSGGDSAADPNVVMTEYGQGFVTSERETSNDVVALELGNDGAPGGIFQINSLAGTSPPDPVPAVAGLFSDVIAWQQDPGTGGPAEIRLRYEPRASTLGPEQVVSSPSLGATDAARGLAAAGDGGGEAAVAWIQGTGSSTRIVAEQLYQPPGGARLARSPAYVRTAQPVLRWSASSARWGPITYTVQIDGVEVGQTGGDALRAPSPLSDGAHTWDLTAANPAGLTKTSKAVRVFVDTVAPSLGARLSGPRRVRKSLKLRLIYRDAPPAGLPGRDASGLARLIIRWGDRTTSHVKRGKHWITHSNRRPGRYAITITIFDRAGNRRTVVRHVKIARVPAKPSGKHRP
jgi:hypothetical protein